MPQPLRTILITCDLKLTKVKSYTELFAFIERLSGKYFKGNEGFYIIKTTAHPETIKEALKLYISPIDSLLVIELPEVLSYAYHGLNAAEELLLERFL
jgi:hypothetical protein